MMNGYPIVVVGASAGGVEAITGLFRGLKPNLPAAILIVMHIPQAAKSYLPEILNRHGFLPAAHARDGEKIQPGHVYVAPPGRHLLVENGRARLAFAPLVNHTRPAIDPLFESAASSYQNRVVGVILSGTLSDGSMGLASIKRAGGITVVQSPEEALFDEMPSNALELVQVDYSLPVSEIALLINRISTQAAATEGVQSMSFQTFANSETNETSQIRADIEGYEKGLSANQRSVLTCPDCGGVL